jgi:probable rRNA maturation factor
MSVQIDVQYVERSAESPAETLEEPPSESDFKRWVELALGDNDSAQVSIRIVDEDESRSLNRIYRGKDSPTNVLSFPMNIPEEFNVPMLGDLVICAPVVEREAHEQHKSSSEHWAHMVIHGMLHLLGYDHVSDQQADEMEGLEIELLHQLGFANPYESQ